MASGKEVRSKQEKGMLDGIGGREEPAPAPAAPAAPSAATPIGWMGYLGGALWASFLCGAGLIAWLYFTKGG